MRSVLLIVRLFLYSSGSARDALASSTIDSQISKETFVDKLIQRLFDRLVDQAFTPLLLHHADLEQTALGIPFCFRNMEPAVFAASRPVPRASGFISVPKASKKSGVRTHQTQTKQGEKFRYEEDRALGNVWQDCHLGISSNMSRRFSSFETSPTLVLNADYQPLSYAPLSVWNWKDAMLAVLTNKASVVEEYNHLKVWTVNEQFALPSVIAMNQFQRHQSRGIPPFKRRNVFLRDDFRCGYCLKRLPYDDLCFDHVVPACRGGPTTWENIISACTSCNGRKNHVPPSKLHTIGMRLKQKPTVPTWYQLQQKARKYPPVALHSTWESWLGYQDEREKDKEKLKSTR